MNNARTELVKTTRVFHRVLDEAHIGIIRVEEKLADDDPFRPPGTQVIAVLRSGSFPARIVPTQEAAERWLDEAWRARL